MDLKPEEIKLADDIAAGIGKRWRRVSVDEVKAELRLWLCENHKYVVQWRKEGQHGRNKLRLSLKRRANQHCREENTAQQPWSPEWEYTPDATGTILELYFAYEDWAEISPDGDSDVWASLTDVSGAFQTLNVVDKKLLALRYELGFKYGEIAETMELASADAARMRVGRALNRCAERAGEKTVRFVKGATRKKTPEMYDGGPVRYQEGTRGGGS